MIPRADWRPEPVRPGPVALALGCDRLRGVPLTWLAFGGTAGYAFVRDLVDLFFGKPFNHLVFLVFAMGMILLAIYVSRPKALRTALESLPFPYYPVRVRLARMGKPTGRDEGHVAFLDGWLVFEGERTTFSLSAGDVERIYREDRLARLLLKGEQAVEIVGTKDGEVLKTELMVWHSRPPAVGLSRLPPLAPHPSARAGLALGLALAGPILMGLVVETTLWVGPRPFTLWMLGVFSAVALFTTLLARRLARG